MYKIDSHQHFWRYDAEQYQWIDEQMSAIKRDFLPDDLKREMQTAGIDAAISVQARQTLDETRDLLSFAAKNDFIAGVVGWVPLTDPNVKGITAELAADKKLRGIRHVLHDEPDDFYMLRDDFNAGLRAVRSLDLGLTYDVLIFEHHLPQTIEFVDRHPAQVFVMDHLAKPRAVKGELSPWRERLRELARRPRVYCKLSGLVTLADWVNWTPDQLKPYVDTVLEIFGPTRVMFGSDWPVCLLASGYREWVLLVHNWLDSLSLAEQERIWSGTAAEAYGLERGGQIAKPSAGSLS